MNRFLYPATYVFLGLPYLVFLAGWIRQPYSTAALLLLLAGTGLAIRGSLRQFPKGSDSGESPLSRGGMVKALLPVLIVAMITGVGGMGFQDTDWLRGNSIIRDLVNEPWPVVYDTETGPLMLVYYTAFYLPAAAVGKLLGWQATNHALFLYSTAGLCLCALWVTKLTGGRAWWVVPLFLAFSGMDAIGAMLRAVGEAAVGSEQRQGMYWEWWAGYGVACFPANIDLLVFAPKQALPGWLLTALVLNDARQKRLNQHCIFYLGLSTLWAPYVSMGLVPLLGVLLLPKVFRDRNPGRFVSSLVSVPNALGLVLGLTMVVYFASRMFPHTLPIDVSNLAPENFTLTLFRKGPVFLAIYPLFVVLEFGLLHAFLYRYLSMSKRVVDAPLRSLLITATVMLSLLPWINLSWNNDIVMRACIPALFVTALVTIRVLGDSFELPNRKLRRAKLAVGLVMLVGGVNAGQIAGRQLMGMYEQGGPIAVPREDEVFDLFALQAYRYDGIGYNFVGQYMGSVESPFGKHLLAKRSSTAPTP